MSKEVTETSTKLENFSVFKKSIISGIGWAFGVTIGFVLISTFLVFLLKGLGGLPLIGDWIAQIVEATQEQLIKRSPIIAS